MNVNLIRSQKLTAERQLQRLHINLGNRIMHLYNLNPFLTEIRALIREIMITIADDWDIESLIPQATLKRKEETKE